MGLLRPGDLLQSRYRVDRFLDEGGMGEVYLCTHLGLDTQIVVKVLKPLSPDPTVQQQFEEQFQLEARLLARLNHPGLVKVLDCFSEDGYSFVIQEYIDGTNLHEVVANEGPLPSSLVLEWAHRVLEALDYLHSKQPPVILRDLKPANILLAKNGQLKIVDFGLAKLMDGKGTRSAIRGFVTPGFSPMEQYSGCTETYSDVYSLGATIIFLLTGLVPPDVISRVTNRQPLPDARALNPTVGRELWAAVEKLVSIPPAERPIDAAAAETLLSRVQPNASIGHGLKSHRFALSALKTVKSNSEGPEATPRIGRGLSPSFIVALALLLVPLIAGLTIGRTPSLHPSPAPDRSSVGYSAPPPGVPSPVCVIPGKWWPRFALNDEVLVAESPTAFRLYSPVTGHAESQPLAGTFLQFTRDGRQFLRVPPFGNLQILSRDGHTALSNISISLRKPVWQNPRTAVLSPDGTRILDLASRAGLLCDSIKMKPVARLGMLLRGEFSPDGLKVIVIHKPMTNNGPRLTQVLNSNDGRVLSQRHTYEQGNGFDRQFFSPNGKVVRGNTSPRTVALFTPGALQYPIASVTLPGDVYAVTPDREWSQFFICYWTPNARRRRVACVWTPSTGALVTADHKGDFRWGEFSPDGTKVLLYSHYLWDLKTGAVTEPAQEEFSSFLADSRSLLCHGKGVVCVRDAESGRITWGPIRGASWASTGHLGRRVAVVFDDALRIYDVFPK